MEVTVKKKKEEKAICQKCGDKGYPELLIYCVKCHVSAEHRYCLDNIPRSPDDEVVWSCEECMLNVPLAALMSQENVTISSKRNGEPSGSSTEVHEWPLKRRVIGSPRSILGYQPFVECQAYSDAIPLRKSIWRGSFDVSLWKCGPFKAHLSIKACQKVVDVAKKLPEFLHVEEHHLSHDEWPQSLQITPPTDENIGLYFFPERHKKRLNMLEKAARDKTLRVILDDAELLVFSSYVLPQQHQRFLGKFYLWGLFRRKQLPMLKQPTEYVFSNTNAKRKLSVSDDSIETRVPLGADKSTDQSTCGSREENATDEDRDASHVSMKAPLQASCLNLFPQVVEDMAVQSKMGPSIGIDLNLGLGPVRG